MTRRFRCGLVVGKFAPLHAGHQLVIDTARAQCETTILLSYSVPELPGCEAMRRRHWLATVYPDAERLVVDDAMLACDPVYSRVPRDDAGDDVQHAFVAHVLRRYVRRNVDAVFTSESYGERFARDLQRHQRVVDACAPTVTHVSVDALRVRLPISGTQIRADVHAHRHRLDPRVYASFVRRIALVGGESSGKSTLAAALARSFETCWVHEYGRELWHELDGRYELDDLDRIAREQIAREEAALLSAHRYVFCDTTPLTTLFYSLDLFGTARPALRSYSIRTYDLHVLCAPDFEFVQDGTRRDSAFRLRQHQWYIDRLQQQGIAFVLVTGSIPQRVEQVGVALEALDRPSVLP